MEKPGEQIPTPENIDAEIVELIESLHNNFDFNSFSPEIQDEWYWVEQKAGVAKDRASAKIHLEQFIEKLKKEPQKS